MYRHQKEKHIAAGVVKGVEGLVRALLCLAGLQDHANYRKQKTLQEQCFSNTFVNRISSNLIKGNLYSNVMI